MRPTHRLRKLFDENGPWAIQILAGLALNRLRLVLIRWLLRDRQIYFQGPPRILGRRAIVFGERFTCGKGSWIEAIIDDDQPGRPRLVIGNGVAASDYFHVAAVHSVTIGDNVLIGSGVLITDHGHGSYGNGGDAPSVPPNRRPLHVKGPVRIGKNVWLGDGVRVLSGVSIGDNAVIAANTVVRDDVPESCVFGAPESGRPIRVYDSAGARWTRPGNNP